MLRLEKLEAAHSVCNLGSAGTQMKKRMAPGDRATGEVDEKGMLDEEIRTKDRLGHLRQRNGQGHGEGTKMQV